MRFAEWWHVAPPPPVSALRYYKMEANKKILNFCFKYENFVDFVAQMQHNILLSKDASVAKNMNNSDYSALLNINSVSVIDFFN